MVRLNSKQDISWVNNAIIILNILYFIFLELAGSSEDARTMIRYGALYIPLAIGNNEYYRLVTAVFMHFGIHHLVNNMLVLFVLGDKLERAMGKVRYLLLYLIKRRRSKCSFCDSLYVHFSKCSFCRSVWRHIWSGRRTDLCSSSKPGKIGKSEYPADCPDGHFFVIFRLYQYRNKQYGTLIGNFDWPIDGSAAVSKTREKISKIARRIKEEMGL